MAGDWIKMRTNLDSDPAVIEMAVALKMDELSIIGRLWKVWSWADQHSINGNAMRVTDVTLDRFSNCPGFAVAMRNVGWLEGRDGALTFPHFDRHNGQTAKTRALTKDRVANYRNEIGVTDVTQSPLPEKRREDKRRDKEEPPTPLDKVSLEDRYEVPLKLRVPEFMVEWDKWLEIKGPAYQQKKMHSVRAQLNFLDKMGVDGAIQSLKEAIRGDFKSLYEPKEKVNGRDPSKFQTRILSDDEVFHE